MKMGDSMFSFLCTQLNKETQKYKTEDGRDYGITKEYLYLLSSDNSVISKQLLNAEVTGNIDREEASEILETIKKIHNNFKKVGMIPSVVE